MTRPQNSRCLNVYVVPYKQQDVSGLVTFFMQIHLNSLFSGFYLSVMLLFHETLQDTSSVTLNINIHLKNRKGFPGKGVTSVRTQQRVLVTI